MFVDRAKISIKSGKGGDGCVSFRREPFVPEGGPNGGDGGKGGDVIFQADSNLRTLMDFRYKRKYEAEDGQNGMKYNRFGKKGENLVIKVPPGTIVLDEETDLVMKDLVRHGDSFVAARGGKGGKGNVNFKNSVRQGAELRGGRRLCPVEKCDPGTEAHCRRRSDRFSKCRKIYAVIHLHQREPENSQLSLYHDYAKSRRCGNL